MLCFTGFPTFALKLLQNRDRQDLNENYFGCGRFVIIMIGLRLKPGFHMIVRIAPIVPVVSKNVQTIGTIIWKRKPDDDWTTTSIACIESSSIRTIGTIVYILKQSYGNALRRPRQSKRSNVIPEIITFIPVIAYESVTS